MPPTASLTRRESFSASHRLISPHLSEAENQSLYGKCYRANGHGHNYVLEVTLRGPISPQTGIVYDLAVMKKIIQTHVLEKMDHLHLNFDVPEFQLEKGGIISTVENIAVVVWGWLSPHFTTLLYEVKVWETEKNIAVYRGE